MTKPSLNSFFVGRALAQSLNDKLSEAVTYTLSEVGKFNAEQGEKLRQFTEEVLERAARETGNAAGTNANGRAGSSVVEAQVTIDELRAEIARLRSEIQTYRVEGRG